jgi:probable F420-dependent oxidoreductase
MKFSVGLPTGMEGLMYPVPFANAEDLIEIAKIAEELGYDAVMGNDHMITQAYVKEEYTTPPKYWEVLVTLAAIAAETTTLRLATGVLVPAMRRDIVVLAKQIATLDQFSGGRLFLGMGIGAYREEFNALHPDWKVHRGNLLEECIQALRVLFTERNASWQGKYFHFEDVEMYPKPLQDPLPFYIGGNSNKSLERTARYGQAWLSAGMPVDQMAAAVEKLKILVEQAGRDWAQIEIAPQFVACVDQTHEAAAEKYHNSQMYKHLLSLSGTSLKDQAKDGADFEEMDLIGTPDEIIEKLKRYEAVGVNHAAGILFTANSMGELKEQIQMFAENVIQRYEA